MKKAGDTRGNSATNEAGTEPVEELNGFDHTALGEDSEGRALLIFCWSPYSMHDLNDILLSLPIDIVAAQHVEGGPEAQLYISVGETQLEILGSYETGFRENDSNDRAWPIPNVIGVRPREQ